MKPATFFFEWLWKHTHEKVVGRFMFYSLLWIYQHAKQLMASMKPCANKKNKTLVPLFFFEGKQNFGDQLNLDLFRYFGISVFASKIGRAKVIGIGSLMEELLYTQTRTITYKDSVTILGTGFMLSQEDENESFNRPVNIVALRGRFSLARCEKILGRKMPEVVLGDPGLLIGRMFPDVQRCIKYDAGIICHYHDVQSKLLKNVQFCKKSVVFIDILSSTKDFVNQVAQCKFIFSSALHGIICADALGIPNRPMVISGKVEGNGYKFQDYYSAFENRSYDPIYLRDNIINDDTLDSSIARTVDFSVQTKQITEQLERALKKWSQCLAD